MKMKLVMEQILPTELLCIIFSFITIKELCIYDTALSCKNNRVIFLHALKNYIVKNLEVSEWTYLKGIKSRNETCIYYDTKYISSYCQNLVINNKKRNEKNSYVLNITNNNITSLHIDLNRNNDVILNSINAEKLKTITIVYLKFVNIDVFKLCPSVRKVNIFKSEIENSADIIRENNKINILIK